MCGSAIEQRHGAHVHVDVRVHMGECLVMGTSVYVCGWEANYFFTVSQPDVSHVVI